MALRPHWLRLMLRARKLRIVLYEATLKKREFLKMVAARLGLSVEVSGTRIEQSEHEPFDVITARACAPLRHYR